jgi:predicted O-methyltransferase YrrM
MRVVEGDCADVLKARDRESVDIVFMDAFDGDGLIP